MPRGEQVVEEGALVQDEEENDMPAEGQDAKDKEKMVLDDEEVEKQGEEDTQDGEEVTQDRQIPAENPLEVTAMDEVVHEEASVNDESEGPVKPVIKPSNKLYASVRPQILLFLFRQTLPSATGCEYAEPKTIFLQPGPIDNGHN